VSRRVMASASAVMFVGREYEEQLASASTGTIL
jgi:hypothetical protein